MIEVVITFTILPLKMAVVDVPTVVLILFCQIQSIQGSPDKIITDAYL